MMSKVFVSYSWSLAGSLAFVDKLSNELEKNGVEVIVDRKYLQPGMDKYVFMEQMIVNPEICKVLIIIDPTYTKKANARAGGVGQEVQMMTNYLYNDVYQTKFIPIIAEKESTKDAELPVFLSNRLFIDMSSQSNFDVGLISLLEVITGKPVDFKSRSAKNKDNIENASSQMISVKRSPGTIIAVGNKNRISNE